jgi:hypothetical protein
MDLLDYIPRKVKIAAIVIIIVGFPPYQIIKHYRNHDRAIAKLESLGAIVSFDFQTSDNKTFDRNAVPPGKPWAQTILGKYYKANPVSVELYAGPGMRPKEFTDQDIDPMIEFTYLARLVLQDTSLTDRGLEECDRFSNVTFLDLTGTAVTPHAVEVFEQKNPITEVVY